MNGVIIVLLLMLIIAYLAWREYINEMYIDRLETELEQLKHHYKRAKWNGSERRAARHESGLYS